ncbi:hypothetical protein DXT77_23535 [Pseudomonas sp. 91RF]|jgi:hypothetical protein|uniref:hypothetical protein n=1 Tax=Pseudomonas sp. 91RF TaxID=2292261 RepID=UPI000E662A5D|nr:hypothetical protein [Pseudomonas sp. 91RF]RIJ07644.1 hypothetical protein DXT77_23535 [Pseudomonas sp. 91RF]
MNSQVIVDRYIATCVENINEYELDDLTYIRSRSFAMSGMAVEEPSKAAIVGEGVLAFTGELTGNNKSDAQNAFLFATLVANKKFPEEDQGKEWYQLFRQVMTDSGWTPVSKYYNNLHVAGNTVRMDKLVLEILGSVIAGIALPGTSSALMLKVAGDAVAALQKRDTALTLYERNLLDNGVGGMAAAACTEVAGEAIMAVGAVRFKRKNTSTKVLFVDVDIRNVNLYRGETVFARNSLVADATRESIKNKLGSRAVEKIDEYEI